MCTGSFLSAARLGATSAIVFAGAGDMLKFYCSAKGMGHTHPTHVNRPQQHPADIQADLRKETRRQRPSGVDDSLLRM